MTKVIWTALEGHGKSYILSTVVVALVERNAAWRKQTNKVRPIVSNQWFTDDFMRWANDQGVPILPWQELEDLIQYENCDVICDEVGNYFDARRWQDLSRSVRSWLSQGDKRGIEFYGAAQDFEQVDVAFRRLTTSLYNVKKVCGSPRPAATRPPVKRIWGLLAIFRMSPQSYKSIDKAMEKDFFLPSFKFIERKYCEIFDTTKKIPPSQLPPLKHQVRFCTDPTCKYHTEGIIKHV